MAGVAGGREEGVVGAEGEGEDCVGGGCVGGYWGCCCDGCGGAVFGEGAAEVD